MNQPLIPTPVVDKNGRYTTVHKRTLAVSESRSLPMPNLNSQRLSERDSARLKLLVRDAVQPQEVADAFRGMDGKLVREFLNVCEDYPWLKAMRSTLGMTTTAATPEVMELKMQQAVAVKPMIDQVKDYAPIGKLDKLLTFALGSQYRWGHGFEWSEDAEVKARGCVLAQCISGYEDSDRLKTSEEDAQWIGENAERLMPYFKQLVERKAYTRDSMEPLLDAPSSSLSSGIL